MKFQRVACVMAFFLISPCFAGISKNEASPDCKELTNIILEMNIIASNLANVDTTRTPEGGPYKYKKLNCSSIGCEVMLEERVKYIYLPDHPDANEDGLVAFPDVDRSAEVIKMAGAKKKFELLVTQCSR